MLVWPSSRRALKQLGFDLEPVHCLLQGGAHCEEGRLKAWLGLLLDLQCAPSDVWVWCQDGPCHGRSCASTLHEVDKDCSGCEAVSLCVVVNSSMGVLCKCDGCGCFVTQMLAAISLGGPRSGPEGGASNVTERYVVGHFEGHPSRECADLFMNAHEKGVGAPASHFLDGWCVEAI